jgi:hypothetical protein
VIGIVVLLGLFIGAVCMVVEEYAKGAVRTAVDEAAQAGATAGGSVSSCVDKWGQVIGNLLPGPLGQGLMVDCRTQGNEMVASVVGEVHGLIFPVPPLHMAVFGFAVVEQGPAQ